MAGNQGLHSAENGKKGGRPRSEATILREVLIRKIEENAEPIAEALLKKGMTGDVQALRELLDRGLGKPQQSVDHTTNGKDLPQPILGFVPEAPESLTADEPPPTAPPEPSA